MNRYYYFKDQLKPLLMFFIVIILLNNNLNAQFLGAKINDDAVSHFFVGAWLTEICNQKKLELWQSGLIILVVGLLKEYLDIPYSGFSTADLSWTMAGWVLDAPLHFSVEIALSPFTGRLVEPSIPSANVKKNL